MNHRPRVQPPQYTLSTADWIKIFMTCFAIGLAGWIAIRPLLTQ